MEYKKIQTLFDRKSDFTVDETKIRWKEFEIPKVWEVSEKIDGMNVRIMVSENGNKVEYSGRTDRSQLPANLLNYLIKTFTIEKVKLALTHEDEKTHELKTPDKMIIFGEGYGKGIQKVGYRYRDDVAVRIFDVFIYDETNTYGGWWLEREAIEKIVNKINIKTVPFLGYATIDEIKMIKEGSLSVVAKEDRGFVGKLFTSSGIIPPLPLMEGIVAKTNLFTRKGERLIFKLKYSDYHGGNKEE